MPSWTSTLYYLAGLFDGEGCVSVTKSDRKLQPTVVGRNRKCTSPATAYNFRIQVNSTDYKIVNAFKTAFGGEVVDRPHKNIRHKKQWCWRILRVNQMHDFAEALAPLCQTKKPQLEALLLARQTYGHTVSRGRGCILSPEDAFIRELCCRKIRQANAGCWDNVELLGHNPRREVPNS